MGLGAILPVDIQYPTAFDDGENKPLDAANRYVLHFDKGQTPPTNVSWSISMYDPQGYYVPNKINRYNLAGWMPLKYNADGSLDIHIQTEPPGAEKEANWLPAPTSGPFNLVIRNFWPQEAMLDGSYKVPPVKKMQRGRGQQGTRHRRNRSAIALQHRCQRRAVHALSRAALGAALECQGHSGVANTAPGSTPQAF